MTLNKFVNDRPSGWTALSLLRSKAARYKGVMKSMRASHVRYAD